MGQTKENGISSPQLVFTDAEARDDLLILSHKHANANVTVRPRTASGDSEDRSRLRRLYSADPVVKPAVTRAATTTSFEQDRLQPADNQKARVPIGVALGSPTQSPWANWAPASPSSVASHPNFDQIMASQDPFGSPALGETIKQRGRWKMFGGLFSKKTDSNPASPAPFYKAQVPSPYMNQGNFSPQPFGQRAGDKPRHRRVSSRSLDSAMHAASKGNTSKLPRSVAAKSPLKRADTELDFDFDKDIRTPTPPPKDYPMSFKTAKPKLEEAKSSQTEVVQFKLEINAPPSFPMDLNPTQKYTEPKSKPLLLEVDIPEFSMERYSVMFGNVLKPRQSSLMVRRQAQLENLKVIDTPVIEEPPLSTGRSIPIRRATVPSPAKSPSYHLFPFPAPPSSKPSSKPSTKPSSPYPQHPSPQPLRRSATSPALSPARATFESIKVTEPQQTRTLQAYHSPPRSDDTPVSNHDHWNSDLSPTSTEASLMDDFDEINQFPLASKIVVKRPDATSSPNPVTDVVSSPSSPEQVRRIVLSDEPVQGKPGLGAHLPPNPRSGKTTPAYSTNIRAKRTPSLDKPLPTAVITIPPLPRNSSLPPRFGSMHESSGLPPNPLRSSPATNAEISIARQISISRRSQLKTQDLSSRHGQTALGKTIGEGAVVRMGPTRKGSKMGHFNRKSEHVLLETA